MTRKPCPACKELLAAANNVVAVWDTYGETWDLLTWERQTKEAVAALREAVEAAGKDSSKCWKNTL